MILIKYIGLFFGTFDPLHNGHITIAEYFIEKLNLNELRLVVTPHNPFKSDKKISHEDKRLEMVNDFCLDHKQINCSKVEFDLPKPNYTADTLDCIVKNNPNSKLFVILGEDNLNTLHMWKDFEKILKHQICVYPRKNSKKGNKKILKHQNIKLFQAPLMEISSSLIRDRISRGESIKDLVPKKILHYLQG